MANTNCFLKMLRLIKYLEDDYSGTAEELAAEINVSRRTLFRYLDELRDSGAEIEYSKSLNSYSLKNNFNFFEDFFKSAI